MNLKLIKPELASVIAAGCDITRDQALKLIEHAVKPFGTVGRRKIAVQGLGDVFLRAEKAVSSAKSDLTKAAPAKVEAKFFVGDVEHMVTFGGLEGDPATPPPDFEPINLEAELRPLVERQATIFFTRHGDPFLSRRPQAFFGKMPSVKIATLRTRSSVKSL